MNRAQSRRDRPTPRDITEGLIALGAKPGDVLHIRCGLRAISVRAEELLAGIRDVIGPRGTIVVPAFVPQGFRFGRVPLSTPKTPP